MNQAKLSDLTPADFGIAAAAFDESRRAGYGDDDTLDTIRDALIYEANIGEADATSLAYDVLGALADTKWRDK